MKVKTIFLLFFFPFLLMAQENTNTEQKNKQDWKFAAGVTVFGNTKYSSYQTRQPLTFNLRYALTNRHILRMNIPIARNEKIFGDSNGTIFPIYPSPEALAKDILNSEVNTTNYNLVRENKYNLYGISVGYDYNYHLINKLSVYTGVDIGLYRLKTNTTYYDVSYFIPSQAGLETHLSNVTFGTSKIKTDFFSIKPTIGLRYQLQRLLIEGAVGYQFANQKFYRFQEFTTYFISEEKTTTTSYNNEHPSYRVDDFFYTFNLLYTF